MKIKIIYVNHDEIKKVNDSCCDRGKVVIVSKMDVFIINM